MIYIAEPLHKTPALGIMKHKFGKPLLVDHYFSHSLSEP